MPSSPRGLIPVVATPFSSDGSLDIPSLERLVHFLLSAGADGLALFGMASEGFALVESERIQILRCVKRLCGTDFPLVAGINATSTVTAIEQGKSALNEGADMLMVLPPYLVRPTATQLVDFFGEVGTETGGRVMVQDAPAVTGVSLPVQTAVALSKLDQVMALKIEASPSAPKIGALAGQVSSEVAILGGQNALFCLEEYDRGAVGTMPACEFTDVLRKVLDLRAAGEKESAHALFATLLPLIRFGMQPGLAYGIHKEVLVRRGILDSARVRLPAAELDPETVPALHALLDRLRLDQHVVV